MPINILYIELEGKLKGGGQISLLNLIKCLNRKEYKPYVICSYEGDFAQMLQRYGVEVYIVEITSLRSFNLIAIFRTLCNFIKIIKKCHIQIVHSNVSRGAIYACLAAKFARIPHIWHVRIPYSDGWIDRFVSTLSSKIIVVAKNVRERFPWVRESKLHIVYNGVDLKYFSQESLKTNLRTKLGYDGRHRIVGSTSRIHPEKCYHVILEAVPKVISKCPNARFLFAGDSTVNIKYKKELDSIIEKYQLQNYVRFIEFDQNVARIIAVFDILVTPTLNEGFARSIIEGMACGKPVIVSNHGGNVEAVINGENGIVIPLNDPSALANAIIDLFYDDEKRKRIAIGGRKRVEKYFTNEIHVSKIEKIYRECIS